MKRIFVLILIVIVIMQLAIAYWLGVRIYRQSTRVLGSSTVVPLQREDYFVGSDSSKLAYYYESRPNPRRSEFADWLHTDIFYTINNDSFNDSKDYSVEKTPGAFRIMALGDSYTFGHYVNTRDNWTERLEDMLNSKFRCRTIKSIEVINIAEPGFDVQYNTHKFVTRGKKYNPDLLIWYESSADFTRVNELLRPIVEKYEHELTKEDINVFRAKGEYFPAYVDAYKELYKKYSQEDLLKRIGDQWLSFFKERGETPLLFVLPRYIVSASQKSWLESLIKGVPNVSIFEELSELDKLQGLYPDFHPNPVGHAIIADDIYAYLTSHNVIPCLQ